MSFLLCGQTDSGKSTISGHLLHNVGYFRDLSEEDKKLYRKDLDMLDKSTSKSKYSVLMDLADGEILDNKTKTRTFDICKFNYEGTNYQLIDTPGHKLFIRSFIDGLFSIKLDCVCLVVSCIQSEFIESFEKGTVKEDLLLARSTGCRNLIVIWNKMDLVDDPIDNLQKILMDYVKKLSYKSVEHTKVSGYRGDNLMSILELVKKYKTEEVTTTNEDGLIEDGVFIAECIFIASKSVLITKGYTFMMHSQSGENLGEILAMKQGDGLIRILKNSNLVKVKIKIDNYDKHKKPVHLMDKIIIRDEDDTIGFGVIKK